MLMYYALYTMHYALPMGMICTLRYAPPLPLQILDRELKVVENDYFVKKVFVVILINTHFIA